MAVSTLKFSSFGDIKSRTDREGLTVDTNEFGIRKLTLYVSTKSLFSYMIKFTFTALRLLDLCHLATVYVLL